MLELMQWWNLAWQAFCSCLAVPLNLVLPFGETRLAMPFAFTLPAGTLLAILLWGPRVNAQLGLRQNLHHSIAGLALGLLPLLGDQPLLQWWTGHEGYIVLGLALLLYWAFPRSLATPGQRSAQATDPAITPPPTSSSAGSPRLLLILILALAALVPPPAQICVVLLGMRLLNNRSPRGAWSMACAWMLGLAAARLGLMLWQLQSERGFVTELTASPLALALSFILVTGMATGGLWLTTLVIRFGQPRWLAHLTLACACLVLWQAREMRLERNYSQPLMGTDLSLKLWGPKDRCDKAVQAVIADMWRIEKKLSLYRPDSEINALNAASGKPQWQPCSSESWANIATAHQFWKLSGGSFDPTIGPLMNLWGFYQKQNGAPSAEDIAKTLLICGMDKIELDPATKSVRFTRPGMAFDPGGITKGYAVDRAVDILRQHGLQAGIVNLGGNIRCLDQPPAGTSSYLIGILDPRSSIQAQQPAVFTAVDICGLALSTSGSHDHFVEFKDRRYGHIIDPRSGQPAEGFDAVTVIHPSAMVADICSTAIYVGGEKALGLLVAAEPQLQVLALRRTPDGQELVAFAYGPLLAHLGKAPAPVPPPAPAP